MNTNVKILIITLGILLLGWIVYLIQKRIGEHQALDWKEFIKANPQYATENIPRAESKDRGCPCLYTTPCNPRCACIMPASSTGCAYCCKYGSLDQRTKHAERLVHKFRLSLNETTT